MPKHAIADGLDHHARALTNVAIKRAHVSRVRNGGGLRGGGLQSRRTTEWIIEKVRAMADRCRQLLRVAVRDDVREQLRGWAEDFEAEADALEKTAAYSSTSRPRRSG